MGESHSNKKAKQVDRIQSQFLSNDKDEGRLKLSSYLFANDLERVLSVLQIE